MTLALHSQQASPNSLKREPRIGEMMRGFLFSYTIQRGIGECHVNDSSLSSGFSPPNPVSIHREYLRPRVSDRVVYADTSKKMKLLGAKC